MAGVDARGLIVVSVVLVVTGALIGPYTGGVEAQTQSRFDFGDAPDGGPTGYPAGFAQTGSFPTLRSSDGARTETTMVRLGQNANREADANLALPPMGTGDADDGITDMVISLTGIPSTAKLAVAATPAGSIRPGTTYYLNVLVDLNMNGEWGGTGAMGEPEWAVRNHRVVINDPNGDLTIIPPAFAFGNGARLPNAAWMRIALTSTPVRGADWGGTGAFTDGEIEDHFVSFRVAPNRPPRKLLRTDCGQRVYYFNGRAQLPFSCFITNPPGGVDPTEYDWALSRLDGGVISTGPPNSGLYFNPAARPFAYAQPAPNAAPLIPPQGTGTVVLAPGETIGVPFIAHRGVPLPSRWIWQVTIADPPASVHTWGVVPGHSGKGQIELEFREIPATCDDYTVDICENQLLDLVDTVLSIEGAERFVKPDDAIAIEWATDESPGAGPSNVVITKPLDPDEREVAYYSEGKNPPVKPDITIKTTPDGFRTVMNSEDTLDAAIRGIYEEWIVVTFGNPFSQAAWNVLWMRLARDYSEVTLPNGETGTVELLEEKPKTLYIVRSERSDAVLNRYGAQIGVLPEGYETFANPPSETGITIDPSSALIFPTRTILPPPPPPPPDEADDDDGEESQEESEPEESPLVEILAKLLGGAPHELPRVINPFADPTWGVPTPEPEQEEFTPVIPELPENPEEYETPQKKKPWTEAILKREKPSYTKGMSYLQESKGGSYAVGMYTSTYARQAAQASPSYGATAAVAVGGGYFGQEAV